MRQILLNLLSNSLKFTYNGFIKLSIDYLIKKKKVLFIVEDSGLGIKEEDFPKLFNLFGKL